jgi:hypothetical protein
VKPSNLASYKVHKHNTRLEQKVLQRWQRVQENLRTWQYVGSVNNYMCGLPTATCQEFYHPATFKGTRTGERVTVHIPVVQTSQMSKLVRLECSSCSIPQILHYFMNIVE